MITEKGKNAFKCSLNFFLSYKNEKVGIKRGKKTNEDFVFIERK